MCTLSFIPGKNGYLLAMNRDERLTREAARPPTVFELNGARAVFPYESSGGTWIGGNDRGLALALLNQNLNSPAPEKVKSRGMVVRKLLGATSVSELQASLHRLELAGMLPFRLLAFVPHDKAVLEWAWHGAKLQVKAYPWKYGHWFSSGLGDDRATRERGAICQAAWRQARAGTLTWLRQVHRSHRPKRGAFSICVHRNDAQTVSYTEISCGKASLELRYYPGPACGRAKSFTARLQLQSQNRSACFF